MFALLSNILLLVPFAYACYLYLRRRERFFAFLSAYLLLAAVVIGMKFALRAPRPGYEGAFDPFSFPSFHTAFLAALVWFFSPLPAVVLTVLMGALRVLADVHTWLDVVGGALVGMLIPPIYFRLRSWAGKEADRKAFHMGFSVLLAFLFYRAPYIAPYVLALLFLAGLFLYTARKKSFVRTFLNFYGRGKAGKGAFTLVLGLLILSLLDTTFTWKAAFFVGYVDGLATITGKIFGTRKKSIYGMLGGLVGGIWAALCTNLGVVYIVVAVLVESAAREPLDDNVCIPLSLYAVDVVRRLAGYM